MYHNSWLKGIYNTAFLHSPVIWNVCNALNLQAPFQYMCVQLCVCIYSRFVAILLKVWIKSDSEKHNIVELRFEYAKKLI